MRRFPPAVRAFLHLAILPALGLASIAHAANCDAGTEAVLFACIAAAGNGDTVTLTADVPLSTASLPDINVDITLVNGPFKLTGPYAIAKRGSGTLTLTGPNAVTGDTWIFGGTIAITSPASLGSNYLRIPNGRLLALASMTLAPPYLIMDGGAVGTLSAATGTTLTIGIGPTVTGASTMIFGDSANQGTVVPTAGAGYSTGNGSNPTVVVAGGIVRLAGDTFHTLARVSHSVTIAAGATLDLNGQSISVNNLQGAGTVQVPAANTFSVTGGGNFSGQITGPGRVGIGSGTLVLTGANSYGDTEINFNATLQVGNGGAGGSLGTGNVLNNGTLAFNRAGSTTVGQVISGAGRLLKMPVGTLTLLANNTYTGTTELLNTVSAGNGGTTGTLGTGAVLLTSDLIVNRSNAYEIAAPITGIAGLTKQGAGTLTLSGNSTYQGGTSLLGGSLIVNGNIESTNNVAITNGTLGGSGSVGPVSANSAASISPGVAGPGSLSVKRLITGAGASFDVELAGTAAGTQHDRLVLAATVPGSINLGGTALNVSLGFAPAGGTTFTILRNDSPGAVVGTFVGLPEGATFTAGGTLFRVSYAGGDGNDVVLMSITAPAAPAVTGVTPGNAQATVSFSAGADGGSPILDYTVQCGAQVVTPATSPTVVTGLANGVPVACVVRARNAVGVSPDSAPAMVTPSFRSFSGPSPTGSGVITASFTGGSAGCTFSAPQFVLPPAAPPVGIRFPHGLFEFSVTGCAPGDTLTFTVTYPGALSSHARYWKYGPTATDPAAHWYRLPASIGAYTASFTITDGGLGDDDLAPNGVIVDQGGPGVGGADVPALSQWLLIVLAMLMASSAAYAARRSR